MTTLILSVGTHLEKLSCRNRTLESQGYIVKAVYSVRDAIHEFEHDDFDAVLLCSSLSAEDGDLLSRHIRESGSLIPILTAAKAERITQPAKIATLTASPRTSATDRLRPLTQASNSPLLQIDLLRHTPSTQSPIGPSMFAHAS